MAKSADRKDLNAKARSGDPRKKAEADAVEERKETVKREKVKAQRIGNPSWFVPVMLTLMVAGLLWVVIYYISDFTYPVKAWGQWNLGAGFALMMAGFAMTTRWR
ncbi:cell division protein CrgA [Janibacter sp. GXQ6167]|uniref:cell division protein CrgA n=1 Tax=Janibacter sp. GXQ6167 TaxID=3240791 RepID=UPI0035245DCE